MTGGFQRFIVFLSSIGLAFAIAIYVWWKWEVTIDCVDAYSAARKTEVFKHGTLAKSTVSFCPYVKFSESAARWKVVRKQTPVQTAWSDSETSRGAAILTGFAKRLEDIHLPHEQKQRAIDEALALYRNGEIDRLDAYAESF